MIYLLTDNILFSTKIVSNLKTAGHAVKTFGSPEAMNATIQTDQPTVVLVNLNAQKYDPVDCICELKQCDPAYKVIAFCGHSDKETFEKGQTSGADKVVANSAITMNANQVLLDAGIGI